MNHIIASLQNIEVCDTLHRLSFTCNDTTLHMLSLGLSTTPQPEQQVKLSYKPTKITLCKERLQQTSLGNQLICKVTNFQQGNLVTLVDLEFASQSLEAVVASQMFEKMNLHIGESVIACINESDLALAEVIG